MKLFVIVGVVAFLCNLGFAQKVDDSNEFDSLLNGGVDDFESRTDEPHTTADGEQTVEPTAPASRTPDEPSTESPIVDTTAAPDQPTTKSREIPTTASSEEPTTWHGNESSTAPAESQTTAAPELPTTQFVEPSTTAAETQTTAAPELPTTQFVEPSSKSPEVQTTTSQDQPTTPQQPDPTTTEKIVTTAAPVQTTTESQNTTTTEQKGTTARPNPTTAQPQSPTTGLQTTTRGSATSDTTGPTPATHYCENDQWLYNNGKCYWSSVINGVSGQGANANWYRALVTCSSLGANVISIHSSAQNDAIFPLTCAPDVWLGLVAQGIVTAPVKGWEWTDLSPTNYTHWGPNAQCIRYYRGSCAQWSPYPANKFGCSYQLTNGGTWANDKDCQRTYIPFVCEKPAPPRMSLHVLPAINELAVRPKCDFGWVPYGEKCYWASREKVDYFEAELSCREQKASIASIHSAGESGFVLVSLGATCEDLWVGLVNINPLKMTERSSWEWDDMSKFGFDNWPNHAVPNNDQTKLCTALSTAGYWYNQHCWTLNRYVCMKEPYAK